MIATIVTMRAPGHDLGAAADLRAGASSATSVLMVLAAPVLIAALLMVALDRTAQTAFFIASAGGSPLPVREPVLVLRPPGGLHPRPARLRDRARDPAGVRAQAALGLPARRRRDARRHAAELLRLAAPPVRQRHQRRPAAVLHALHRADLDPDRVHLPRAGMGTLWRAQIRFTVPMLFCLALVLQLPDRRALGGLPLRRAERRRRRTAASSSMAHFHYTIMGGLIFTFFAAIYYWLPKMTGLELNETLGEDPLLDDVHRLQLDLPAAVRGRLHGHAAARRRPTRRTCSSLNDWVSVSAFVLGALDARLPRQLRLLAACSRACRRRRTRGTRSRSSGSCRRRCRCTTSTRSRCSTSDPYGYGDASRSGRATRPARRPRGADDEPSSNGTARARRTRSSRPSRPRSSARNLGVGARICSRARPRCSSSAFVFAYFYLRSLNNNDLWRPKGVDPSLTLGTLATAAWVARRSACSGSASATGAPTATRSGGSRARSALALGLAGVVLQIVEWFTSRLRPDRRRLRERLLRLDRRSSSSSASAPLFWLETTLADVVPLPEDSGELARAGRGLGRPLPDGARHRGSALARPAEPRGGHVLLDLLRRARRDRLGHPLPPLGGSADAEPDESPPPGRYRRRSSSCSSRQCSTRWAERARPGRRDARRAPPARRGVLRRACSRSSSPSTRRSTRSADTLFAAHMTQHLLLLMVAPPLIVLSAPWLQLWRAVLRSAFAGPSPRASRAAAGALRCRRSRRLLSRPLPAWIVFNVLLVAWHVPVALRRDAFATRRFTTSSTRPSCWPACCSGCR